MSAQRQSFLQQVRLAWKKHQKEAEKAYTLYAEMCDGNPPPRVPGMDTVLRLAYRIWCGRTIEEAAAKEYLYRWALAVDRARAFGAPHALGM